MEAENPEANTCQILLSTPVLFSLGALKVLRTVHLNNQFGLGSIKVNNVIA
jgi:hypothetical protein